MLGLVVEQFSWEWALHIATGLIISGLRDVRKEIVMMIADKKSLRYAIKKLDETFHFDKPNHGIVFTSSLCLALGSSYLICSISSEDEGEDEIMYQSIFTIVDRGKAEYVMDAATKAGAKGVQ